MMNFWIKSSLIKIKKLILFYSVFLIIYKGNRCEIMNHHAHLNDEFVLFDLLIQIPTDIQFPPGDPCN